MGRGRERKSISAEAILAQALRDAGLTARWRKGLTDVEAATVLDAVREEGRLWFRREAEAFALRWFVGFEPGRGLEVGDAVSRAQGPDFSHAVTRFFRRAKVYLRELITAGVLGLLGPKPLSGSDLNDLEIKISVQEAFLNGFEADVNAAPPAMRPEKTTEIIAIAPPITPLQFIARAEMYGQAPWHAAQAVMRGHHIQQGIFTEEKRTAFADERSCEECPRLADLGWQPIGSLPPIGDQGIPCRQNCRCYWSYR